MIQIFLKFLFVAGCAAFLFIPGGCTLPSKPPPGEEPLLPISESGKKASPAKKGQQLASLELTERGRRTLSEGKIDQAVSLFQKAVSLDPRNPYAYYYLGEARFHREEYEKILTPLEQAGLYFRKERHWLSKVHTLRGRTFEALLQWDQAREEFQKAVRLDRGNPEAREGLERVKNTPQ